MKLDYAFAKILSRFSKNKHEYMSDFFRKSEIKVGKNCNITCDIRTTESYLVTIGDNVTISTEVLLLTHDASVGKIFGKENGSDLLGKIQIGDNCFIGARATILPGINIANNVIIAAGTVVTKTVSQEKVIVAGNPGRIIGDWDSLMNKSKDYVFQLHGKKGKKAQEIVKSNLQKLISK